MHALPARVRLLLVSDVATALRAHPRNVRRYIQAGALRAHRLGSKGSRWRISLRDLEAFLRSRRGVRMGRRARSPGRAHYAEAPGPDAAMEGVEGQG